MTGSSTMQNSLLWWYFRIIIIFVDTTVNLPCHLPCRSTQEPVFGINPNSHVSQILFNLVLLLGIFWSDSTVPQIYTASVKAYFINISPSKSFQISRDFLSSSIRQDNYQNFHYCPCLFHFTDFSKEYTE